MLWWVMIESKEKQKEENRKRKVEGRRTLQGRLEKRHERNAKRAAQAEGTASRDRLEHWRLGPGALTVVAEQAQ